MEKDTEAAVIDAEVPQVDPQVIGRQVSLTVAVDADGVDVIRVCVCKNSTRRRLHQQIHRPQDRNLREHIHKHKN